MQTLDASTKRAAWHERRHSAEAQFINRPFRNDDVKVDIDERLSSCQHAIAAIQTINNPFLALKKSREVKTPRDEKNTPSRKILRKNVGKREGKKAGSKKTQASWPRTKWKRNPQGDLGRFLCGDFTQNI